MGKKRKEPFWNNRVTTISLPDFYMKFPKVVMGGGRWPVFQRDKFTCVSCGLRGTHVVVWMDPLYVHYDLAAIGPFERGSVFPPIIVPDEMMTIDHKQPRSKGGSNQRYNKQTMCRPCNHRKADLWVPPTI